MFFIANGADYFARCTLPTNTYVYNGQGERERDGYCKTTREGPIVRELSIKTCLPAAQVANDNMQRCLNFTYVFKYLCLFVLRQATSAAITK